MSIDQEREEAILQLAEDRATDDAGFPLSPCRGKRVSAASMGKGHCP
jgi:hypothetical protein